MFKAVFVVNDAADDQNLLDKILKQESKLADIREKIVFDIVSTQMAIHYMFESEQKLRAFFRNVTERLEPGSFFIGTTIDSDELVYRIRENGNGTNTISNEFYTVVLPQDSFSKDKSPFGHKYYFYLKEAIGKETQIHDQRPKMVDEFLIVFDVMEKIANEYGLKLVMKKNIRQYFDDMCSPNPVSQKFNKGE
jgi:mRNA (guanine-N7-)-methyltransferase